MTKRNLLDPAAQIAKGLGGRIICRICAPFERARILRQPPWAHEKCVDPDCGCSCHDNDVETKN